MVGSRCAFCARSESVRLSRRVASSLNQQQPILVRHFLLSGKREPLRHLGAQQKLTCSASEKCPRPGTRFRNQFEIVRHYPAKKITLSPRRAARAVKGARRAFILTLDSPSRPIESAEGTKRNEVQ